MADQNRQHPNSRAEIANFLPKERAMADQNRQHPNSRAGTSLQNPHDPNSRAESLVKRLNQIQRNAYYRILQAFEVVEPSKLPKPRELILQGLMVELNISLSTHGDLVHKLKTDALVKRLRCVSKSSDKTESHTPLEALKKPSTITSREALQTLAYYSVVQAFAVEKPKLSETRQELMRDLTLELRISMTTHNQLMEHLKDTFNRAKKKESPAPLENLSSKACDKMGDGEIEVATFLTKLQEERDQPPCSPGLQNSAQLIKDKKEVFETAMLHVHNIIVNDDIEDEPEEDPSHPTNKKTYDEGRRPQRERAKPKRFSQIDYAMFECKRCGCKCDSQSGLSLHLKYCQDDDNERPTRGVDNIVPFLKRPRSGY